MSVIHSNPTKCRSRILELLHAQSEAGYGMHLFDPKVFGPDIETPPDVPSPTVVPTPSAASLIHGLEDTSSDSHLWLVPTIVEYVKETGDLGFLDLEVPFAEGTPATVYQHLVAALDFSAAQVGANGVALGLRADWNDCLNLGGGESALVTFLHAWAIRSFLEVAHHLGRTDDVERLTAELERIRGVANSQLWDGSWWLRGYTGDGVRIGSEDNAEGKIFLEHQPWPVIAGITSDERGRAAMDSVRDLLGSRYGTHLNWPAFTEVDDTVGFVTRVYPGVKENAAIFSHPNAWPIIAEAILGRGDAAMAFYDSILPYHQNDLIEVRLAEPYVYAQFVYGRDHEFFGRAENPWLTGTAGWMYTAVTKWILGIRPTMEGLLVDPCIPTAWDGFEVRRRWRGATYLITVRNPDHVSRGVASVSVDGVPGDPSAPIPAQRPGAEVRVEVTLG
jgi:N,N'-diacetylchitobiose phosphorylase